MLKPTADKGVKRTGHMNVWMKKGQFCSLAGACKPAAAAETGTRSGSGSNLQSTSQCVFPIWLKRKKKSSESHLDDTLNHQPNDLCNQLSSSPRGMGHISFNWTTIPMRSLRCRVEFFWITDYPWSFNLLP